MTEALDWAALGDPDYVSARYRARQLQDAAALGLGVAQVDRGPDEALLPEIDRLESDLMAYTKAAWHVIEPGRDFVPNWHLGAVAEHLQAVTGGEITRLLINMPPRCMKSLSVSVFWMTWEWTHNPFTQWLFLTYHKDLCTRDSLRCRRLILSRWYRERWGHVYQLASDQRTKVNFENNRSGIRVAQTMSGSRGKGGDRIVVDDPHNTKEAESPVQRATTLRDWDEEISTRLNDPTAGAYVVMMQRLHQKDLTGHILDQADDTDWEHLMLPMEYDPKRSCVTVLGDVDPRKKAGAPLWPARFPKDATAYREMRRKLGPYGVAGQWQQNPVARAGGQFERAWFSVVNEIPKGSRLVRVRFWDLAGTEDAGAYTCGTRLALRVTDGRVWVENVVRGQWAAADRDAVILRTAERDAMELGHSADGNSAVQPNKLAVLHMFEQEPGSGGKAQVQSIARKLRGYRVEYDRPTGDKFVRADPFAGAAKGGEVELVKGSWNDDFLDEIEAAGPGAAYLDIMDSASGAYNRLLTMWDQRKGTTLEGINMEVLDDDTLTREPAWKVD